jgi:hypothetical protein
MDGDGDRGSSDKTEICISFNERGYITALGCEICFDTQGLQAAGAGGLQPSAECECSVLYSTRHFSITIWASFNE